MFKDKDKKIKELLHAYEIASNKMEEEAAKLPIGSIERKHLFDAQAKMSHSVGLIPPYKQSPIIRSEQMDWSLVPLFPGAKASGFSRVQREWDRRAGLSAEDSELRQNAVLQGGRTSLYGQRKGAIKANVPPKKQNPPVDNQREQSNTQALVQAEKDALKRIGVNSGPINDLSQNVSFKSSVLINNQKVELTQQQVLSNGKILPVGTIAKLDKKGVVATFPNGKTVRYAGVTEQKALPKPDSSVPKIRPNGTVELFTDSKGVQIPGAVGVSPSDPMAVARDARSMPNIPTGSQARVIANNPYIPKPEGKFTIMDYLPEAARITKKGGEIVINGTPNNKYLRGIPNEAELARMGLRLKYNGPLKEEFKQLKFHQSNGKDLRSTDYKTIVFEKVK